TSPQFPVWDQNTQAHFRQSHNMNPHSTVQRAGESRVEEPASASVLQTAGKSATLTRAALLAFVWLLALYQFSETTVAPDLWGHVVFGQQMLKSRAVERG